MNLLEKLRESLYCGKLDDICKSGMCVQCFNKLLDDRELLLAVVEKLIEQRDFCADLYWKTKDGNEYAKQNFNGYFFNFLEGKEDYLNLITERRKK